MNLYQEIRQKARRCRDRDVRIKVELFCLALKLQNVSEACARRGFSRKFYYKWWKRFKRAKFELWGLEEKSRRPYRSPNRISVKIEQAIRWYNRRGYGARRPGAAVYVNAEFLEARTSGELYEAIGKALDNLDSGGVPVGSSLPGFNSSLKGHGCTLCHSFMKTENGIQHLINGEPFSFASGVSTFEIPGHGKLARPD